jgi:hypothetical protein
MRNGKSPVGERVFAIFGVDRVEFAGVLGKNCSAKGEQQIPSLRCGMTTKKTSNDNSKGNGNGNSNGNGKGGVFVRGGARVTGGRAWFRGGE